MTDSSSEQHENEKSDDSFSSHSNGAKDQRSNKDYFTGNDAKVRYEIIVVFGMKINEFSFVFRVRPYRKATIDAYHLARMTIKRSISGVCSGNLSRAFQTETSLSACCKPSSRKWRSFTKRLWISNRIYV